MEDIIKNLVTESNHCTPDERHYLLSEDNRTSLQANVCHENNEPNYPFLALTHEDLENSAIDDTGCLQPSYEDFMSDYRARVLDARQQKHLDSYASDPNLGSSDSFGASSTHSATRQVDEVQGRCHEPKTYEEAAEENARQKRALDRHVALLASYTPSAPKPDYSDSQAYGVSRAPGLNHQHLHSGTSWRTPSLASHHSEQDSYHSGPFAAQADFHRPGFIDTPRSYGVPPLRPVRNDGLRREDSERLEKFSAAPGLPYRAQSSHGISKASGVQDIKQPKFPLPSGVASHYSHLHPKYPLAYQHLRPLPPVNIGVLDGIATWTEDILHAASVAAYNILALPSTKSWGCMIPGVLIYDFLSERPSFGKFCKSLESWGLVVDQDCLAQCIGIAVSQAKLVNQPQEPEATARRASPFIGNTISQTISLVAGELFRSASSTNAEGRTAHNSDHNIWPTAAINPIAIAACVALLTDPVNTGRYIEPMDIQDFLSQRRSYEELCKMLEARGFMVDRKLLARRILDVVPQWKIHQSNQSPAGYSKQLGLEQKGTTRRAMQVRDNLSRNYRAPEFSKFGPILSKVQSEDIKPSLPVKDNVNSGLKSWNHYANQQGSVKGYWEAFKNAATARNGSFNGPNTSSLHPPTHPPAGQEQGMAGMPPQTMAQHWNSMQQYFQRMQQRMAGATGNLQLGPSDVNPMANMHDSQNLQPSDGAAGNRKDSNTVSEDMKHLNLTKSSAAESRVQLGVEAMERVRGSVPDETPDAGVETPSSDDSEWEMV